MILNLLKKQSRLISTPYKFQKSYQPLEGSQPSSKKLKKFWTDKTHLIISKFRPMEHPSFINACSSREFNHYHRSLFRKIFRQEMEDSFFHEDSVFELPYWSNNYHQFKQEQNKIRSLIFMILALQMSVSAFYLYLLYQANDDLDEWFLVEHTFVDKVFSINTRLLHRKIMNELEFKFDKEFDHRMSTETDEMYYDRLRSFIRDQIGKFLFISNYLKFFPRKEQSQVYEEKRKISKRSTGFDQYLCR